MASIRNWILKTLSGSFLRGALVSAVTKFPNIIKFPALIDRGLRIAIYPEYTELRYLAPDKEKIVKNSIEFELSEGDTFIDAGAHIGYYSLIAADIVGPDGCVVAFEPHPVNAHRIRENARQNDLDITVEEAAVSGQTGKVRLSEGENSLSHSIEVGKNGRTEAWSLDEYITKNNLDPDLIKMDIEGAESRAIEGMASLLERSSPIVLIEIHPWISRGSVRDIVNKFLYHDYRIDTPSRVNVSLPAIIELHHSDCTDKHGLHILAYPSSSVSTEE